MGVGVGVVVVKAVVVGVVVVGEVVVGGVVVVGGEVVVVGGGPCGVFTILILKCAFCTTVCTFTTSEPPKVVRPCCVFYLLLRATTVRAFNTSEPPKVFNTFDFEMCFAPQRRAICHLSSPQTAPRPPL